MKLSKTTRANPTQTKTLQKSYALALRKLFRIYKIKVLEALQQSNNRFLAEPTRLNIIWLAEQMQQLGTAYIIIPGNKITADYVRKSYSTGTIYAGMTLKQVGIEPTTREGPADWRAIDALKVRNLSALKGITDETNKQIISEITTGIQMNEGIADIAKRITGKIDSIGIVRATTIARTETINAFNQAAEIRFQQHGIEVEEWLTASDERVCPICGPLNGKQFRIDSSHERPPCHPNCRCCLLPVL